MACHEGLILALQWSDKPVLVELDCPGLVDTIVEKSLNHSAFTHLISEIKNLSMVDTVVEKSLNHSAFTHFISEIKSLPKECTTISL
jgi:hypothetical protein